ncbi:hypothetical protein WUBG_15999, partial [Wuchereria bancrofti]
IQCGQMLNKFNVSITHTFCCPLKATFPKNDGADNRQKFCLLLLDTVDHTYQTIGPIIHSFKRRA